MGSGASCPGQCLSPLDERLRTMLILRAYNCRPRDWTMKDQFDAAAKGGILTKEDLRKALRLSECPRIEALLDRHLLNQPVAGLKTDSARFVSVEALITFLNSSTRGAPRFPRLTSNGGEGVGEAERSTSPQPPPPPSNTPSVELHAARRPEASESKSYPGDLEPTLTPTTTEAGELEEATTDGDRAARRSDDLSPRVVRLTAKVALTESANPNEGNPDASGGRRPGRAVIQNYPSSSAPPLSGEESPTSISRVNSWKEREDCESGPMKDKPCVAITTHLGTTLGLPGTEAYRRPGPGKSVWRKRETVVQERTVQYTTLDETGTVQELYEMEKSQTEVLHMECRATGEFAHRESTHYEGGEAFNGEVVLEEAGAEQYVHFRSVDDEYEHLESTLPPRARHGAADTGATGEGAGGRAEERASDVDEQGGGDIFGASTPGRERRSEESAVENPGETAGKSEAWDDETAPRHAVQTGIGMPPEVPGEGYTAYEEDGTTSQREDQARYFPVETSNYASESDIARGGDDRGKSKAELNGRPCHSQQQRQQPSPSLYHFRSPSCSPRLAPRPVRSPYRQEGVGAKERSGRGEPKYWQEDRHNYDDAGRAPSQSIHASGGESDVEEVHGAGASDRADRESLIIQTASREKRHEENASLSAFDANDFSSSPAIFAVDVSAGLTCGNTAAKTQQNGADLAQSGSWRGTNGLEDQKAPLEVGATPWATSCEVQGRGQVLDGNTSSSLGEPSHASTHPVGGPALPLSDVCNRLVDGSHGAERCYSDVEKMEDDGGVGALDFTFRRSDPPELTMSARQVDFQPVLPDEFVQETAPAQISTSHNSSPTTAGDSDANDEILHLVDNLRAQTPPAVGRRCSPGDYSTKRPTASVDDSEEANTMRRVNAQVTSTPAALYSQEWKDIVLPQQGDNPAESGFVAAMVGIDEFRSFSQQRVAAGGVGEF